MCALMLFLRRKIFVLLRAQLSYVAFAKKAPFVPVHGMHSYGMRFLKVFPGECSFTMEDFAV